MLYAFLCYNDEDAVFSWSQAQDAAVMAALDAVHKPLEKAGRFGPAVRLMPTTAATTLRKDSDPPLVLDGPYAETKEQIGGIAINKFTDIDRALEAWLKHPCLPVGDVLEIRPVDEEFNARIAARDTVVARH